MAPHALKMLTSFIFIVAVINSIYYAIYLSYDPVTRRINHLKRFKSNERRSGSRLRIPIVKVVWIPGPNRTRIKQTIKTYWVPEYSCSTSSSSSTKVETTVTIPQTTETDYRDPEDYEYTHFRRGDKCRLVPLLLGPTYWQQGIDPIVMERVFSLLNPGGAYKPAECVSDHYVAIVVPYKGTNGPLLLFLFTLHLAMLKQEVNYQVFVVREFDESQTLNTGKFFNIGFLEAYKVMPHTNWTCFVFHNPYVAPTDARNLYRCSEKPKQLFGQLESATFDNKFGEVIAMKPEHFRAVNGFSNLYYESDPVYNDMYDRLIAANFTVEKPSVYAKFDNLRVIDEYADITTTTTPHYPTIEELTSTVTEPKEDGLSNLHTYTAYHELRITHTLLIIDTSNKKALVPGRLMSALIRVPTNPTLLSPSTTDSSTSKTYTTKTTTEIKTISTHNPQLKKIVRVMDV